MKTDALIEALAADTRPVRQGAVQRRLAAGLGAGAIAALLLSVILIGIRSDLEEAASGGAFWASAAYASALGLVGFLFAVQLARPDCGRLRWSWTSTLPVLALAWAASMERPGALGWPDRLLAAPWSCVPLILILAVPLYAGIVWALRAFAPTRMWAAGAAAGLAAGGFAAAIHVIHWQHLLPGWDLIRCTAAIALAAGLGGLAGPRLLRW